MDPLFPFISPVISQSTTTVGFEGQPRPEYFQRSEHLSIKYLGQ